MECWKLKILRITVKLLDKSWISNIKGGVLTRVVPSQNNDSRESEMDSREKIGIAKIIHKFA